MKAALAIYMNSDAPESSENRFLIIEKDGITK